MSEEAIKAGDVVRLKSGGPKMTVEKIGKKHLARTDSAWVAWFEGDKQTKAVFDVTSIEKA